MQSSLPRLRALLPCPCSPPVFLAGPCSPPFFLAGPCSPPFFLIYPCSPPFFLIYPCSPPFFLIYPRSPPFFLIYPRSPPFFLAGPCSPPSPLLVHFHPPIPAIASATVLVRSSIMYLDTLELSDVLEWIKLASKDEAEAANLKFFFDFRDLVKCSTPNLKDLKWINVALVNDADTKKIDYVREFWLQVQNSRLDLTCKDNIIIEVIDEIGSGISLGTINRKETLWQKKKSRLSSQENESRIKFHQRKRKFHNTWRERYLEDVEDVRQKIRILRRTMRTKMDMAV
jgi:hypothetical protein